MGENSIKPVLLTELVQWSECIVIAALTQASLTDYFLIAQLYGLKHALQPGDMDCKLVRHYPACGNAAHRTDTDHMHSVGNSSGDPNVTIVMWLPKDADPCFYYKSGQLILKKEC